MKALVGFAGFDGPGIALREAGIDAIGIEIDASIAEINRYNGGNCLTEDLLDVDPTDYIGWLLYHFSPPCPSFSVATQGCETEMDLALARKICEFIKIGGPIYFTLENVWGYRKSLSWQLIQYTLLEEGYGLDAWYLNAADYGVPQSRRRMIAIARRDGQQPAKPWPTHSKMGDMFTVPWRGWYEAVEDLIPDLPETRPAPWQMDRMPDELKSLLTTSHDMPTDTITANNNQTGVKAFVVDSANANSGTTSVTVRDGGKPIFTVTTNEKNVNPKAFITASANRRPIRAGLAPGRWVSMTPRCLARFQDFPDSFVLPDEPGLDENIILKLDPRTPRKLACRGIGNALPVGVYRSILRSLL